VYQRGNGASAGNYTVIYGFTGPGTQYASLEDGNYELKFNANAIQGGGPGGPSLGSSMAVDPAAYDALFSRFFGDVSNADRTIQVTNLDLPTMQHAINTVAGNANYYAYLDFGNRAFISSADYSEFNLNYKWKMDTSTGTRTQVPA